MRCGNCGAQLKDGARFCESCGASVVNTTPPKKNNSQPKKSKKGGRGILLILLVAAIGAGIYLFSNLFGGGGGGNSGGGNNPGSGGTNSTEIVNPNTGNKDPNADYEILSDLSEVLKPTPENSPGNPAFINVSFTDEEYENSPAYIAPVSRDLPGAEFTDYGIQVNLKGYNLHNDLDSVLLEVMPVKTDPTYGHELYTYNFWMASGQDKFGTDVELTLPIHNGPKGLRNVLWHNWDTGEWEELYYTVADDGKTCTAYIDHFSEIATEEATLKQIDEMNVIELGLLGDKLMDVYEGGSIFVECPNGFQGDQNHASVPVGLVPVIDYVKIARRQTYSSQGVFDVLLHGGGIPASAGWTESLDNFGYVSDGFSNVSFVVGQAINVIAKSPYLNGINMFLSAIGTLTLNLRIMDMTLRTMNSHLVAQENRWNVLSTYIGAFGTLVAIGEDISIPVTTTAAVSFSAACSWACMLIFAGTLVATIEEKYTSYLFPYGQPMTIEEGAYHEYLKTPTRYALEKLNIPSPVPLTGDGQGWAEAIKIIYQENKGVLNAEQLGDKIIELYNTYINYFWDNMSEEEQGKYWRKYMDWAAGEYCADLTTSHFPTYQDEKIRVSNVLEKSGNIQYNNLAGVKYAQPMDDEGWERVKGECGFDNNLNRSHSKEFKHRAMETVCKNTNKVIYDILQQEYRDNVKDTRRLLYNEVLPMMNTTLLFYADDQSLSQDESIDNSLYYGYNPVTEKTDHKKLSKMEFDCDQKARFFSHNITCSWYTMYLLPKSGVTTLGRYNVFHYMQFGAPGQVRITPPEGSSLPIIFGEVALEAGIPYKMENSPEYGLRVPVVFNGKGEEMDVPVVDAKMRVDFEDITEEYNSYLMVERLGDQVEKHLFPRDVNVYVLGDGTVAVNMPALNNFSYESMDGHGQCTVSRDKLTIKGKVVKTWEGHDKYDRPYTCYLGILVGDYNFSASWTGNLYGRTHSTIRVKNTIQFQRDGQSPAFSKFALLYYPKEDFYQMCICFIGTYETVQTQPNGEQYRREDFEEYIIYLTTGLEVEGNWPDDTEDLNWK